MKESYVFIAKGIGITPFRSIIKNLLDTKAKASIMLFYISEQNEYLFQDVFAEAEKYLDFRISYLHTTQFNKDVITKKVDKVKTSIYYLSGPQEVIERYREILFSMEVSNDQIKTDLFIGYN